MPLGSVAVEGLAHAESASPACEPCKEHVKMTVSRTAFPSPYEMTTPAAAEGWERL